MASPEFDLLKGSMPELSKMKRTDIKQECEMWRNLWNWTPSEVKYYVARVGKTIALTMRNYKRHIGVLLDTKWTIDEVELGVSEKEYDHVTGKHFFEKKIIRTKVGGVIDVQFINERVSEEEMDTFLANQEVEGDPKTEDKQKDI